MAVATKCFGDLGGTHAGNTLNAEVFFAIGAPGKIGLGDREKIITNLTFLIPACSSQLVDVTPGVCFGDRQLRCSGILA